MKINTEVEKLLRENGFDTPDKEPLLWFKKFGFYNAVCFIDLKKNAVYSYQDDEHRDTPKEYKNLFKTVQLMMDEKQATLY